MISDKSSNMFAEDTNHWNDVSSPVSLIEKAQHDLGLEVKPIYKQIKATYLSLSESEPFSPEDLERNGIFVMHGIGKGVEVTKNDVTAMRQAQYDMFMPRDPIWNVRRAVSSFLGLNVCNMVVLLLAAVLCFLIYLNNNDTCPNFSRANLFYAILAVIWVAITALGIYSAHKRIVNNLRYYMIGISLILLLGVCVTGYGLLSKDNSPDCNGDSSQTIILISTGVFALLDIGFFLILCKKLRNTLLQQQNRSTNNRNVSRNINSNRNNAPNVRAQIVLSTGPQSNRAMNGMERGNRSDRQANRNNNRAGSAYRVTGNSSRSRGRV